uniref:Uncharacterized protein n=1 Tax=Phenylobacterium glaciei TaxID=2803784 RepID=A0A974S906_9CAUL|nr:hypothetical protein JKL49_12405 [Phenylobacterium glaciei]
MPIGAASPLWFMFTGAASAGVAYWWMTRWLRPMNLEALLPPPAADAAPVEEAAILIEAFVEPLIEAVEPLLEAGVVDPDPAPVPAPEPAPNPLDTPPMEAAAEAVAPAVEAAAEVVEPTPAKTQGCAEGLRL